MQAIKHMRIFFIAFVIMTFFLPVSFLAPQYTEEKTIQSLDVTAQGPLDFFPTPSIAQAQSQNNSQTQAGAVDGVTQNISFGTLFDDGFSFVKAIGAILYYIVLTPIFFLVQVIGTFLDIMISISIDSATYSDLTFIEVGWGVVRDIANIGFIFALLYVAVGLVFDIANINVKKLLISIIVVALVINFSLFLTRVVLDVSNILARVFYNNMTITVDQDSLYSNQIDFSGRERDVREISSLIVTRMNPQYLLSVDLFSARPSTQGQMWSQSETDGVVLFVIILLIIVYIITLGVFVSVSLLFLLRIVTLALGMVLAPLAFATLMFPGLSGVKKIGFHQWMGDYLKAAFMAPVFLFFIYIIVQFLSTDWIRIDGQASFWVRIMQVLIPMAILLGLLQAAKSVAIKMSGEAGAKIAGFAGNAASAVVGVGAAVATGGTAMAMRGTLGAAGAKVANSKKVNDWRESDSMWKRGFGNISAKIGEKASTGSFDWRQTSLGKNIASKAGFDNAMGAQNMFSQGLKGGYKGQQERKDKAIDDERKLREKRRREEGPEAEELKRKEGNLKTYQNEFSEFNKEHKDELKEKDEKIEETNKIRQQLMATPDPADAEGRNRLNEQRARAEDAYKKAKDDKKSFMQSKTTEVPDTNADGTIKTDKNGNIQMKTVSGLDLQQLVKDQEKEVRNAMKNVDAGVVEVRGKYAAQVESSENITRRITDVIKIGGFALGGAALGIPFEAAAVGAGLGAAVGVTKAGMNEVNKDTQRRTNAIRSGWSVSNTQAQNIPQQPNPQGGGGKN